MQSKTHHFSTHEMVLSIMAMSHLLLYVDWHIPEWGSNHFQRPTRPDILTQDTNGFLKFVVESFTFYKVDFILFSVLGISSGISNSLSVRPHQHYETQSIRYTSMFLSLNVGKVVIFQPLTPSPSPPHILWNFPQVRNYQLWIFASYRLNRKFRNA